MNPLSSHPPRTPRVSVVSSNVYNLSAYEKDEISSDLGAESIDEEDDERMKEAERRIRHEEIWREIVLTSNGRDKAFVRQLYIYIILSLVILNDISENHSILNKSISPVSHLGDR